MSHAQQILVAGYAMLQALRRAGLEFDEPLLREYYRRVERWCVDAETPTHQESHSWPT